MAITFVRKTKEIDKRLSQYLVILET